MIKNRSCVVIKIRNVSMMCSNRIVAFCKIDSFQSYKVILKVQVSKVTRRRFVGCRGPLKALLNAISKKSKFFKFLSERFWQISIQILDSAFNVGNFYPNAGIWHPQNQNFKKFSVSGAFVQCIKII